MIKGIDFIKQVFAGKTISRILFNWQVKKSCRELHGVCLDLASGKNPSYQKYWDLKCEKLIKAEYNSEFQPDLVIDLNRPILLEDNFADNIFLFGALYILKDPGVVLREVFRVLKPGGSFFLSTPFVANEMPEPHDYFRFTSEKLRDMLKESNFREIEIIPIGERFCAAAHILHPFFLFNFVRLFVFSLALFLDKLIPKKIKENHPCPAAYFIVAKK